MGKKVQGNTRVEKTCVVDGCWGECPTHNPNPTGFAGVKVKGAPLQYSKHMPGQYIPAQSTIGWNNVSYSTWNTVKPGYKIPLPAGPSDAELAAAFMKDMKTDWSITPDKLSKAYADAVTGQLQPDVLLVSPSTFQKLKQIFPIKDQLEWASIDASNPVTPLFSVYSVKVQVDKSQLDGDLTFVSSDKKAK